MLRAGGASSVRWIDRLKTMGDKPSKLAYFLAELRRRHVFRVAVGYAAFAFVVLQLGEIILPAFSEQLPSAEWALQLMVVLAVLGFPVVMVLAWVFDVTSEGIRVTSALDRDASHVAPSTGMLPRLALLTVTLLAVGGVGSWWIMSTVQGTDAVTALGPSVTPVPYDPDDPIRSIAVLPLENFSENADQDYFVAGMHEALIARLSRVPELRVVSRTTVARYASSDQTTPKTIPEIVQELGVEGIVEGSVFRAGDEVRITVQLIHGASDTHIWAQDYTRSFTDVLALQSEVANAIAEEIQAELSIAGDAPMPVYAEGSAVPAANEAFMRARFGEIGETREGLLAALENYRQAVEADPSFAAAYAGLAGAELMLGMSPVSSPVSSPGFDLVESMARARVFALKAFEIDPELPEAHDILALINEQQSDELLGLSPTIEVLEPMTEVRLIRRSPSTGDGVGGGAAAEDAIIVISVDPGLVSSAGGFRLDSTSSFESFSQLGRQLRAGWADWANQAVRMASMSPGQMVAAAQRFKAAGRPEEAIQVLTGVSERSPEHAEAWEALEVLYAFTGEYEQVLDVRRQWVEQAGGDAESIDRLEEQLRTSGAEGYWTWRLEVLQERASEGEAVPPVYLAAAQAALGDAEAALVSLEEAVRTGDRRLLTSLRTDPVWDVLRSDSRLADLLRGITNARLGRAGRGQGRGGRSQGQGRAGRGQGRGPV